MPTGKAGGHLERIIRNSCKFTFPQKSVVVGRRRHCLAEESALEMVSPMAEQGEGSLAKKKRRSLQANSTQNKTAKCLLRVGRMGD